MYSKTKELNVLKNKCFGPNSDSFLARAAMYQPHLVIDSCLLLIKGSILGVLYSFTWFVSQDTLRNQNLSTGRRLQRLQRVSGAMKEQLQAFSPVRSAASHRHLNHTNIMTMNEKRNCYSIENLPTESTWVRNKGNWLLYTSILWISWLCLFNN